MFSAGQVNTFGTGAGVATLGSSATGAGTMVLYNGATTLPGNIISYDATTSSQDAYLAAQNFSGNEALTPGEMRNTGSRSVPTIFSYQSEKKGEPADAPTPWLSQRLTAVLKNPPAQAQVSLAGENVGSIPSGTQLPSQPMLKASEGDGVRYQYSQLHQFDARDPRQRLQRTELEIRKALADVDRQLAELRTRDMIAHIIEPIRGQIEPHISLQGYVLNEEEIIKLESRRSEIMAQAAEVDRQKSALIDQDSPKLEEFLGAVFPNGSKMKELEDGVAYLRDLQRTLKSLDGELNVPRLVTYNTLAGELMSLAEMLRRVYDSGESYNGPLRRQPRSFFGAHVLGGAGDALSPTIFLKASIAGGMALIVDYGRDQTVEDYRARLLRLVDAEIGNQSRQGEKNGINSSSWRLLREYLMSLVEQMAQIERSTHATPALLLGRINELQERRRRVYEAIHKTTGPDMARYVVFRRSEKTRFDIARFIRMAFREFMSLFDRLPIADEIEAFARQGGYEVKPHAHDSLLSDRSYLYGSYVKRDTGGKLSHPLGEADLALIRSWDDSSALIDSLVNPRVFYHASARDRVLMRLVDAISRHDWGYQAALAAGEGNLLESATVSEGLARKIWFMERKWRAMSPENKAAWLTRGFGRVVDEKGKYSDTIHLGVEDSYTG